MSNMSKTTDAAHEFVASDTTPSLCKTPVAGNDLCWQPHGHPIHQVADRASSEPQKSVYYRHLDACGRCRRARGTLQLCDIGANLFRLEQERHRASTPAARVEGHKRNCNAVGDNGLLLSNPEKRCTCDLRLTPDEASGTPARCNCGATRHMRQDGTHDRRCPLFEEDGMLEAASGTGASPPERVKIKWPPPRVDAVWYYSDAATSGSTVEYILHSLHDGEVENWKRHARNMEETVDNVREAMGLESTHWMVIADDVRLMREERDSLDARVAELEGALRPFEDAAKNFPVEMSDDLVFTNTKADGLTVGHLRAARACLEGRGK